MTVFFQGCPHKCKGCHNPETWDYSVRNECSVDEILSVFDQNPLLTGITLSGGEPFSPQNFDEIIEICKSIKERDKDVWIYTGYVLECLLETYPFLKENLLPYVDVIVDGPFVHEERSLKIRFRGSRNQRLIDVKKFLDNKPDYCFE